MKRQAFLIESSQITGEPDLPGARVDTEKWKQFLLSDKGGAWEDYEIETVHHPSSNELRARLLLVKADYVFITFSGHGYHLQGEMLQDTHICLRYKDNMPIRDVVPSSARCTFVIDSCREVVFEKMANAADLLRALSAVNERYEDRRAEYRALFDSHVLQAGPGLIRLFACNIGEVADEGPTSGGLYTRSLIQGATNWHRKTPHDEKSVYSVWNAHSDAAMLTTAEKSEQHPQYDEGRRYFRFPLAVKP